MTHLMQKIVAFEWLEHVELPEDPIDISAGLTKSEEAYFFDHGFNNTTINEAFCIFGIGWLSLYSYGMRSN